MSDEMFYFDKNGVKQDKAIHEEMLNNPEAEAAADELAAKQAVERQRLERFSWKAGDVTIRPATAEELAQLEANHKKDAEFRAKQKKAKLG
jgi:hypothetical protein